MSGDQHPMHSTRALTTKELAGRMQVSVRSIQRATQKGTLDGWRRIKVGGSVRFVPERGLEDQSA